MKAERSIERSIDSLQRIYAVIVALAINESMKRFFLKGGQDFVLPSTHWPEFIAFMFTSVPFLHGMNRHLDRTLSEVQITGRRWLLVYLLIDFGFFLAEGCLFFSLASTVNTGLPFFENLLYLLLIDVIWAIVTLPVSRTISRKWIAINLAVSAFIITVVFDLTPFALTNKTQLLAAVAILRTIMDYWFGWNFYFPPEDDPSLASDPPLRLAIRKI